MADLYVNGEWRTPVAGGHREIRCPADGTLTATVSEGTRPDTEAAIAAAREAFDTGPWPNTPERERVVQLVRGKDLVGEIVLDPRQVLAVQATPMEEGRYRFELVGSGSDEALYFFVVAHGFEENERHSRSVQH